MASADVEGAFGAARWEAEGSRRTTAERKRNDEAHQVIQWKTVLHHLCWADVLYAMAGMMDHLTRILRDMTNSVEQLGMRWKEKCLSIAAWPYTECKAGDVVEIFSDKGRRWVWRVVEGMEALGSWLDSRGCSVALFFAKKALLCDPKVPVKRRMHAFYSTCEAAVLHGACEWAYTQSMFQALRIW